MKSYLRFSVFAALFCLILPIVAVSQEETTATLNGQVTDSTGAVIQNATVTVTNLETKAERKAQSGEDGVYVITNLPPGPYTLKVEVSGFKTFVQTGLVLNAKDRRLNNVALEAGTIGEMVTVTSQEAGVMDSPTTQSLISNAQIVELPLNN
ncbi:MAG TPA: carboxypeptidase-like regulatory domain-containing protein, partial [Pyrinomonadaceae bacterium]